MLYMAIKALLAFLFPPHCPLCAKPLEKPGICAICSDKTGCRIPGPAVKFSLDGIEVFVLESFNDQVRQLIHLLKYQRKTMPARLLGEALGLSLMETAQWQGEWTVVPVPLHPARQRERGYNQSAVIARALSNKMGFRTNPNMLKRLRQTKTQTELNREERLQNVAGAFCLGRGTSVLGIQVLLVDDVITTGATACSCARILLEEGANRVVIAAVSRPELGDDARAVGLKTPLERNGIEGQPH